MKNHDNFNNDWNRLGLYMIPSHGGHTSYFLKRSWGNYLFFPHPEIENMFPFILSCGGVYKVFDCTLPFCYYNKLLFDKFGAATIGPERDHHEDFLIEKFPDEYFDVDMKLLNNAFNLQIKDQSFLFLDVDSKAETPEAHHLLRYHR